MRASGWLIGTEVILVLKMSYFLECDLLATNKITYWEFYLKRKTEIGGEILKLMKMHF